VDDERCRGEHQDLAVADDRAPAQRPVIDPGVLAVEIDDVGGRRRPQQGAVGPRDGAVLDRDAAGGRPAQEDLLRTEHPGTTGGPPWLERHAHRHRQVRVGQQVEVAGRRVVRDAVDPGPEELDAPPGDLEPVPRPEPADELAGAARPRPGPRDQVHGVDAAGVDPEVVPGGGADRAKVLPRRFRVAATDGRLGRGEPDLDARGVGLDGLIDLGRGPIGLVPACEVAGPDQLVEDVDSLAGVV
jgi:hypothetical protein